jgi:hypothetical protein
MPSITLLHPVPIQVQPIDRDSTISDDDAREPIQIVNRATTISLAAQVEYREFATHGTLAEYDEGGLLEGEAGYVAIRTVDFLAASWTPAIGDRISIIGTGTLSPKTSKVYVTRLKPFAHYPVVGALGLKLYFTDRKPSHNG